MIRPFTFFSMILAGVAGLLLYETKHETQMLDRQIMAVLKQTDQARERIGAMQAELSLLSQPDRLKELSEKHLGLQNLLPSQVVLMADLGNRLPPPGAPASAPLPPEEPPAAIAPSMNTPIAAAPVAPALPPAPLRMAAKPPIPLIPAPSIPAPPAMTPPPVTLPGPAQLAAATPARLPRPAAPRPAAGREDPVVVHLPPPAVAPSPSLAPAASRPLAPVVSIGAVPIQVAHPAPPPRAPYYDMRAASALPASMPAASYGQPAPIQSALGGVRPLLPPPVPYSAQAH